MAGRVPQPDVPRDEALPLTALPRRAAAALVTFAATGALAAGFLDGAAAWLRVVLAFCALIVGPAAMLAGRVAPRAPAAAVVAVLSLHAIAAGVCTRLGASFSLYANLTVWGVLFIGALGMARAVRVRGVGRRAGRSQPAAGALAVLVLVGIAAAAVPRYGGAEDAYDHMGHVRRVIALDAMQPDGVLAMPADAVGPLAPDPRKGAFHDLVAVAAQLAGADPVAVWSLLRVVMYPLSVLAFAAFAARFVRGGALAACLALFLLSYGGTTLQMVGTAAYGQNLAATWYWVIAALVLGGFGASRAQGVALAVLACGGVLVHLGVALHVALFAGSLVLFAPQLAMTQRGALRVVAWLAVGVAAGALGRGAGVWQAGAANEIHGHVQGVMTVGGQWFVMSPMEVLRQHGLVFLGALLLLPLTGLAARRERAVRAAFVLSLVPAAIAFVPPLATWAFQHASYMAFRALLNAPAIPAAVLTAAWLVRAGRARGAVARVLVAAALCAWGVGFVAPSLRAFASDLARLVRPERAASPTGRLDAVVAGLPAGATILADPFTAYRLSAYTSHRYVAILEQHANPRDPHALDRLAATRDVLSPFVIPQAAVEACRSYGVDFVVLSGRERGLPPLYLAPGQPLLFEAAWARLRSLPNSFREFARGEDFVVLHVDPHAAANNDFAGVRAPVEPGESPASACAVPVPAQRFEVTGFAVSPGRAAPGDSLDVTFGYRRDVVAPYGPDVIFHIRFDHESIAGVRRVPGDKHLRRLRERAGGRLLRFRVDVRAGHGIYQPDLWPVGTPLVESFRVAVPAGATPGRYRVEVRAVEETLLPNFAVSDLLFNRDHYAGAACAVLEVSAGAVR